MFCQKVHKPNTFLECTTHYQAYRKKLYTKHYKNSIWSLELTQVDAETKRFRSKCSPGNKHTKTLTQWWIFPKKTTTLNIDTERSEMKNHKGWRRRNGFYRSQDASVCVCVSACVRVCMCMCARVCASRVWRQTWGLFSCQCPAATPAGLCFTVTPKLTNTPKWPRTVCLCACVHTSAWRRLCMSGELNSFQNEPYPKWLMPAVSSSRHT